MRRARKVVPAAGVRGAVEPTLRAAHPMRRRHRLQARESWAGQGYTWYTWGCRLRGGAHRGAGMGRRVSVWMHVEARLGSEGPGLLLRALGPNHSFINAYARSICAKPRPSVGCSPDYMPPGERHGGWIDYSCQSTTATALHAVERPALLARQQRRLPLCARRFCPSLTPDGVRGGPPPHPMACVCTP